MTIHSDNKVLTPINGFYQNFVRWERGKEIPKDQIVLGVKENGELSLVDLKVQPNLLLVGSIGNGKTCSLRTIISTLIANNPERTQVIVFDPFLSGSGYKSMSGLSQVLLASEPSSNQKNPSNTIVRILEVLMREAKARSDLLKGLKCSNIEEYEEETGDEIARIILVLENFHLLPAILNFPKDSGTIGISANTLYQLMSIGPSLGIQVFAASQKATPSIIPPNFNVKMIGRMSIDESLYILGSSEPSKLKSGEKGVFFTEEGKVIVPYLSEEEIKEGLKNLPEMSATLLTFNRGDIMAQEESHGGGDVAGGGDHGIQIKKAIARALIDFKERKKLKAKDLAKLIGTDPTSVSIMAMGDVNKFTIDYLIKCAERLNDEDINRGLKRITFAF